MSTIRVRKMQKGDNLQIVFVEGGARKTLALGSLYSRAEAERIRGYVDEILLNRLRGDPPRNALQGFLERLTDDLRRRFERVGLIEESKEITLGKLWLEYMYSQEAEAFKESTIRTYETAKKRFFRFFDSGRPVSSLTKKDGLDWKSELLRSGYAEASVAGSLQRMMAVLNWAVEHGYLATNPFKGIPRGSFVNTSRDHFVSMDDFEKLLEACPDQTWRTLLTLCRIGGLRSPSETLALKWEDVDWNHLAINVRSPKTERYEGQGSRLLPMFPILRQELEVQWELHGSESPYVISKWRGTAQNMRTHFERIIFRAGLSTYPRLFQNLRESRANELWSEYPEHVASAWLGHSKRTAQRHYLRVTDAQFLHAVSDFSAERVNGSGLGEVNSYFCQNQQK